MDLKQKYTEVNISESGGITYSFDNNFVLALMDLDLVYSIQIVMQVERYVDNNYDKPTNSVVELAGVVKGKTPYYFLIDLWHFDNMLFENMMEIDSDMYLDYYNKNLVLVKY
tara:strand:+ start:391 stop:726 length:336 start_codon:yes stop_codon:yes gene_type:complete